MKRKTATSRLSRALKTMAQWCRLNRHQPIAEQHQTLSQKLHGHFGYYGITANGKALTRYLLPPARVVHSVCRLVGEPVILTSRMR